MIRKRQTDECNKSDLWKGRFWAWNEKEKELWTVEVMTINTNCHEWNTVNVKKTDQYETDEMRQEADSRDGVMQNEKSN